MSEQESNIPQKKKYMELNQASRNKPLSKEKWNMRYIQAGNTKSSKLLVPLRGSSWSINTNNNHAVNMKWINNGIQWMSNEHKDV